MHRALLIAAALLVASCDTAPGPEPTGSIGPILEDFAYSPKQVSYAELSPEQIVGLNVVLPVTMSVKVRPGSSEVREVRYILQQGPAIVTRGILSKQAGDDYAAQVPLTISALDESVHTLLVYAVDNTSRISGEARGTIQYVRSFEPSEPPVIVELNVPSTVQRPAAGDPANTLLLSAKVSDPDGLEDILRAEFWNKDAPESRILMCDDGGRSVCGTSQESGDETAGDGIFTRQVFILSTNSLGVNTLVFQVTDRALLMSEQVEADLEIVSQ